MTINSYGNLNPHVLTGVVDQHIENLQRRGYSVIEKAYSETDLAEIEKRLEIIYLKQVEEVGIENLEKLKELDTVRAPFMYDTFFLEKVITHPQVLAVANAFIDSELQVHLQNGILNRPNKVHHQLSWHRDLPYQNWVISKPISLSALTCATDFNETTGGTWMLPYSHKFEKIPSIEFINDNKVQMRAKRGSIVLFDSMVLHAAGINTSAQTRYGINTMYTAPLLKQQIDSSAHFKDKIQDPALRGLLGIKYQTPTSPAAWRLGRLNR